MKALDTNILARYLRDDDADQARRAHQYVQAAVRRGEPLYVNHVVLCELVWILFSVYEHTKEEITKVIEAVTLTDAFEIEDKASVEAALDDYRETRADFADCLIGRRNFAAGCESTLSFDRRLKSLDTFEVR